MVNMPAGEVRALRSDSNSVEGMSCKRVPSARRESTHGQVAGQRMLYTGETRNGLRGSAARLETP
jgi:hypothetical protein